MRHIGLLVLLAGLVPAAQLPRGVGPEFARLYGGSDGFSCITGSSRRLRADQVNDNSCDCADGSDEPGTAACAHLGALSPPQPLPGSPTGTTNTSNALPGFWCANAGHVAAYLPFDYVNDGVCDHELCCDGSDEWAGVAGVRCKDRCTEIAEAWRRSEKERRESHARAMKKHQSLAVQGRQLRQQAEAKVAVLQEEIAALEVRKASLQLFYENVQREQRGKVARGEGPGGKLGVLMGLARRRVDELRGALDSVTARRNSVVERLLELEGVLARFKEDYNPNFNDEGVKTAVKAWEDYAAKHLADQSGNGDEIESEDLAAVMKEDGEESGINWADFEWDEGSDTDLLYAIEAYLPGPARDYVRAKMDQLRKWLVEHGMLADRASGGESRAEAAARGAVAAAERALSEKQASLEELETDLTQDWGTDDIFRAARGRCVSLQEGEYSYEMCWFGKTTQRAKRGGAVTSLGSFQSIEEGEGDDDRLLMRFDAGQHCWHGPNRRTDVWFTCAETEEIRKVSETEKCVYHMEVGTPLACTEDSDRQGAENGAKDRRDEL